MKTGRGGIREMKILHSLVKDFEYTKKSLSDALNAYPDEMTRLQRTFAYVGLKNNELSMEMKDTILNTQYSIVAIVQGTLNSVLTSDKLELISNDTLKQLLTAYPSEID